MRNINFIKCFVSYGTEKLINIKALKQMSIVFLFFDFIGTVIGNILKGVPLYISIVMCILTVLYIINLFLLRKKQILTQCDKWFLIAGWFSLFTSVFFILLANLVFSISDKSSIMLRLVMIFALILILILFFAITIIRINQGNYQNKKRVKKGYIVISSTMGGVIGISFAKMIAPSLTQEAAINIAVICMFIISMAYSFGTINFLKYYYLKKYDISVDFMKNERP